MITINEHYLKLQASYLFSDIARRVETFQKENPGKPIIKLGIGDVTRELPQACIEAFHTAVDEMANEETFRGYGPEQGYSFLREAIATHDFKPRGANISSAMALSVTRATSRRYFPKMLKWRSRIQCIRSILIPM